MQEALEYLKTIENIAAKDPRYKIESYNFVMAALNHTVSKLKVKRHISAAELLEGIKDFASDQFGPMGKTVIEFWGVRNTLDFGNIVFNLIQARLLGKTPEDKIEDFKDVYDFDSAFGAGKLPGFK